jgi:hypothetical protein
MPVHEPNFAALPSGTKWSRAYFADLLERVVTTALYGVVTMLTADASGAISGSGRQWWLVVGLPTALAGIKGILANIASPDSGPSALPAPPAPEVD